MSQAADLVASGDTLLVDFYYDRVNMPFYEFDKDIITTTAVAGSSASCPIQNYGIDN